MAARTRARPTVFRAQKDDFKNVKGDNETTLFPTLLTRTNVTNFTGRTIRVVLRTGESYDVAPEPLIIGYNHSIVFWTTREPSGRRKVTVDPEGYITSEDTSGVRKYNHVQSVMRESYVKQTTDMGRNSLGFMLTIDRDRISEAPDGLYVSEVDMVIGFPDPDQYIEFVHPYAPNGAHLRYEYSQVWKEDIVDAPPGMYGIVLIDNANRYNRPFYVNFGGDVVTYIPKRNPGLEDGVHYYRPNTSKLRDENGEVTDGFDVVHITFEHALAGSGILRIYNSADEAKLGASEVDQIKARHEQRSLELKEEAQQLANQRAQLDRARFNREEDQRRLEWSVGLKDASVRRIDGAAKAGISLIGLGRALASVVVGILGWMSSRSNKEVTNSLLSLGSVFRPLSGLSRLFG